VQLATAD